MPKLPKFKTEEEFAKFVETHDMAPYWDEMIPVDPSKFRLKRRKHTAVRVPMSQKELKKARKLAERRKVTLERLMREWFSEKLKQARV